MYNLYITYIVQFNPTQFDPGHVDGLACILCVLFSNPTQFNPGHLDILCELSSPTRPSLVHVI